MTSVRFSSPTGPSKHSLRTGISSSSSARSKTRRAAGYLSYRFLPMPGFCTPWPGNSSAMGPAKTIPISVPGHALRPLQERGAPGQSGSESREQDVVAALDTTLADGFLERKWNRRARSVAVLVDVDRDTLDRQADAARRRVDDAEVCLVRHPEVDLVEPDARRVAHLGRLPDEDVDGKLEDVGADHVDERGGVLGSVSTLFDVAGGHLRVAAAVRAQAPAQETRALRGRPHHRRPGAVAEDHGRAPVGE